MEIQDLALVARRQDAHQVRRGVARELGPAKQLVRTAVGIDAIDDAPCHDRVQHARQVRCDPVGRGNDVVFLRKSVGILALEAFGDAQLLAVVRSGRR
jgi:hypothetical protein